MRAEIEHCGQELDSFEELVKQAVNAEAKGNLWPRFYTRKTDQYWLRNSRPSVAKASTHSQPMKDSRVEEPKSKPQKLKAPAP